MGNVIIIIVANFSKISAWFAHLSGSFVEYLTKIGAARC